MKLNNIIKTALLTAVFPLMSQGQDIVLEIAKNKVENYALNHNISRSDYANYIISDRYTTPEGHTHLYFHQTVAGIPIEGAITAVTVAKNERAIMVGDAYVKGAEDKINGTTASITPTQAVRIGLRDLGLSSNISQLRSEGRKTYFNKIEGLQNNVTSELVYLYDRKSDRLFLVYKTGLDDISPEYYDYYIDAVSGKVLNRENRTIHCQFDNHGADDHVHVHTDDSSNKLQNRSFEALVENIVEPTASYFVYPLPGESPDDVAQQMVYDNQYPEASPYGWHDRDGQMGADSTVTIGNNVDAYADYYDDDLTQYNKPKGGDELVFNFPFKEGVSVFENADLGVTNLFYTVNMFHDITKELGFDEASGNFQRRNYTGKGIAYDEIRAEALDGSKTPEFLEEHINNANFLTLPDGHRGRMQMYLWRKQGIKSVFITSPADLEGPISTYGSAGFGPGIPVGDEPAIEGKLVVAIDENGLSQACTPITNGEALNGHIAIVDRGECLFVDKVKAAQITGAKAVLVCNNKPGVLAMGGDDIGNQVKIPSVLFSQEQCDKIKAKIAGGEDVTLRLKESDTLPKYKMGSLDNGIVIHENGHGLSIRLIGGPSVSNCLNSPEQAGEGISDFLTLLLTVKPTDTRDVARGVGSFAADQGLGGQGIRRYKFSTDMDVNPLTFGSTTNIATVDNEGFNYEVGEVWTAMLWELYWDFVDKYGMDPTFKDKNAGNFKVGKLFIEGMKISPCNPTFTKARNAIIEADKLYYDGENRELIWKAFAKRGLGNGAKSISSYSLADNKESFDPTPEIPSSIEDEILQQEVEIYPNPATDLVNVNLNNLELGKVNIAVMGIDGKEYLNLKTTSNKQNHQLDVSGLAKGVYLLKITSKDGLLSKKIILQ